MRITEQQALRERLLKHEQVPSAHSLAALPPYLESFLAHLRLLVGVPFTYLVPDERLLPDESIRFFYLDRSWTDRLVDGALTVGKIGTREVAHAEAHAPAVQRSADVAEGLVRRLQRKQIDNYMEARREQGERARPAEVITGFLLRSNLVSGWPHLEVRAFSDGARLTTLRLERLSPGLLIALFSGVPDRVEIEEPHHGVQFGVERTNTGQFVNLRDREGREVKRSVGGVERPISVRVPMRRGGRGVVHISALRRALHEAQRSEPRAIAQDGSAAFALTVLDPPYRQPFANADDAPAGGGSVAERVRDAAFEQRLRIWVKRDL